MFARFVSAIALCLTALGSAAADQFYGFPFTYRLPDGSVLQAGAMQTTVENKTTSYTMAVQRRGPQGAPDPAFGSNGIAEIPVWRYYEFSEVIAVQPDGKILVAGNAADSILRGITNTTCHPAICLYYPVIARLNPDGTLDKTFNGTGKIVLSFGHANDDAFFGVQQYGTLLDVAVDLDGKIYVYVDGSLYATAAARLLPNGTLDPAFKAEEAPAPTEVTFARYQGLYWRSAAEASWNLAIAQQGQTLFGIWFTYSQASTPSWISFAAKKDESGTYRATLFGTRGPSFEAPSFDPRLVSASEIGSATLKFDDDGHLDFAYGLKADGPGLEHLTRMQQGPQPTCTTGAQPDLTLASNYDGMWWAAPSASEPGWALAIAHQGSKLYTAWMTYDHSGIPMWVAMEATQLVNGDFSGPLVQVAGPAYFEGEVNGDQIGNGSLRFTNGNTGTFSYVIGNVTRNKPITRFVFEGTGTVCSP